jgi:EAL domain-containing protein (putative c-di-GMP-specific phosphodiesterase class I)
VLEVDRLKIDREFVRGVADQPRDRVIVASVIRLAHDLGLDVVAEGVENDELWDVLAELGCDVAQGYGIAAPMGYPELRGWLSGRSEVQIEQVPHTGPPKRRRAIEPRLQPRLPAASH